jgi:hypothetical protein
VHDESSPFSRHGRNSEMADVWLRSDDPEDREPVNEGVHVVLDGAWVHIGKEPTSDRSGAIWKSYPIATVARIEWWSTWGSFDSANARDSFEGWLLTQARRSDPVGDLARDFDAAGVPPALHAPSGGGTPAVRAAVRLATREWEDLFPEGACRVQGWDW